MFDVHAGNLDSVSVGRFLDSNLYLNYAPGGDFTAGGFNSATAYKLNKFTTAATTIGDASNPFNWAFAGSQIAADTLGTVRLSGVETTYWTPCGIKFRSAGGSVQVASARPDAIALNTNLTPGATAIAGNFFYLDV